MISDIWCSNHKESKNTVKSCYEDLVIYWKEAYCLGPREVFKTPSFPSNQWPPPENTLLLELLNRKGLHSELASPSEWGKAQGIHLDAASLHLTWVSHALTVLVRHRKKYKVIQILQIKKSILPTQTTGHRKGTWNKLVSLHLDTSLAIVLN